jgi:hypothetical protein
LAIPVAAQDHRRIASTTRRLAAIRLLVRQSIDTPRGKG